MSAIINATDASFEQDVVKSSIPVLVDFWAPWCGPCKMLAPALEQISTEYDGKVQIVKVNVDDNQAMSLKLGVRGIPAMFLYKDGQVVSQKAGALAKTALAAWIDSSLA